MKLSIIIPVYNEIHTIATILAKIAMALPKVDKEIILVDDGSTDGTREWLLKTFGSANKEPVEAVLNHGSLIAVNKIENNLQQLSTQEELEIASITVNIIFHHFNQGKGAALRTGFKKSTGEVLIIQDADLEYDPQDWKRMWKLIAGNHADIVYGSRFYGEPHRVLYFHHLLGNQVISNLINLLCNTTLTDIEVCYKMFRREVVSEMELVCNDFGFEVEFTIKVTKARKWRIYETGISYYGRTYEEGKKINWKDGVKALAYIVWFWLFH